MRVSTDFWVTLYLTMIRTYHLSSSNTDLVRMIWLIIFYTKVFRPYYIVILFCEDVVASKRHRPFVVFLRTNVINTDIFICFQCRFGALEV